MRLGLLADVHEAVEWLDDAVRELRSRGVESFVVLGDVLDDGLRAGETVARLADLPGAGVWGNHDFGLCRDVHPMARSAFPATVLDYFARLRPFVEFEGRRFQHIDPHLDPERFDHLWQFPTLEERLAGFVACPHERVFMGHLHAWAIYTPQGRHAWDGGMPFRYERDKLPHDRARGARWLVCGARHRRRPARARAPGVTRQSEATRPTRRCSGQRIVATRVGSPHARASSGWIASTGSRPVSWR